MIPTKRINGREYLLDGDFNKRTSAYVEARKLRKNGMLARVEETNRRNKYRVWTGLSDKDKAWFKKQRQNRVKHTRTSSSSYPSIWNLWR